MNITNKKLAFYVAVIGIAISQVLPIIAPDVTPAQQKALQDAILLICGAFGVADVGWDYLNVARRNYTISETSETTVADTAPSAPMETTRTTTTISAPVFTEHPDNVSLAG
jgi:hypothetical protein